VKFEWLKVSPSHGENRVFAAHPPLLPSTKCHRLRRAPRRHTYSLRIASSLGVRRQQWAKYAIFSHEKTRRALVRSQTFRGSATCQFRISQLTMSPASAVLLLRLTGTISRRCPKLPPRAYLAHPICPVPDDAELQGFLLIKTKSVMLRLPRPEDVQGASWFASGRESNLTPSRLTAINKLKMHRRNSEQCDHGRFLRIVLHAVIMRGVGNAPDETPAGTATVFFGSKSAPLFTHHVPDKTSESRSVA
jgi:hypothetical protein